MGAASSSSVDLRPEEVDVLQEESQFAPKEIQALFRRFKRLDRSGRGTLSADDILMIPEVVMNPLAPLLLAQFSRDGESRINFRSFVNGLSVFNERATPDRKAAAVFKIFDVDGDGYIDAADVRAVLVIVCGTALSAAASAEIVRATIAAADKDEDGRISANDFNSVRDGFPWSLFTVPVRRAARDHYFLANGHLLGPTLEGSEATHALELPVKEKENSATASPLPDATAPLAKA